MIYKLQNAGKIAKTIIKATKRAPVSSLDKIPIWKRIFPIMRTAQDDLTEMNKYHQLNVDEYNKTFGTNIQSIPFRTEFPINPVKILPRNEFETLININNSNNPNKNVENVGGYYSKIYDQVVLPNTAKSSAAYHEFEHMGQYGLTNPEVTRWRIEQLVDPEKTANMTDNAKAYFLSEEEFPVHLRQYGENLGIGIGDPYPGDIEFDKLIEENGIGGASTYVRRATPEEKRLMWRAMNGTLFASLPFVSTLFGIQKDKNGGIIKLQNAAKPFESATAKSYFSGLKDYLLHQTKSFTPSLYKPTKGSNIQQQYYTRPGLKEEVVLNLFGGTDSNIKGPLGNYFFKDFDDAYNRLSLANESRTTSNGTLGKYGVSAGIDDRGRYISFIDTFDHVFIPGKGIPIYDRIYEDEIESLYNPNLSAVNEGDWITRSPELKKRLKHKLNKGGVIKLQKAWTTMPSVEDAILRAWSNQSAKEKAKEKAKKQVASEKPKYTYVNPYDYLHGWREATEDAAKQDKYTVENLGGSKEEAEAAYNATKENAAKQLAGTTATGLGTVALLGLSGGAAGPVVADIVNTGFGAHGLYNALSGNGIQKTIRLANQGDTWGAVKSGAGDLLDLSMGLHAAKLWGNLGKSMLAGQSLGNAYRGNVAGRELSNGVRSFNVSKNPFYSNPTVVSTIDHLYKEHPELAAIGPKEAYSQYYKTIFPASKVQIPYAHGTRGDLSKGLEGSTKVSYTAAPETIGRNDFYLNLQPEASLQYADGIGVPEGFTWNKHRFWPLKEILGKPYKSDSWMFEPIQLRRQIPNRAGQFSRVKNADGTYSGHGKLLEEYKAELGMQDLSDKEFLQKFGIKDGETFEQWVAENKQKFSDIYNSGDYQGLYHVKVDASNPLIINGGNTYYSERGIWDKMNAGKNDILLHNNAANEFGSDVMVVKDIDPSKVRILGSDPDKQAFIDFMNGHNISFTPAPQKFVSTVHFDPRVKPLSRPISKVEKAGIIKSERPLYDQKVLDTAKLFAKEYGYPEPVYKQGGILKVQNGTFENFWNTLPENQQDSTDFNVRRYWELNGKPSDFKEAIRKGMYKKEKDWYNANSIAFNEETGEYEFMKSPNHPTINFELDWYNSPKAKKFRNKYQLDTTSIPWKYIPKQQQGGFVTPMTNQFTTKLMEILNKYLRKDQPEQKAVGTATWAYNKPNKIVKDGGDI